MSDAKVASVMYEEGANDVEGLSTVILCETKINCPCSFSSACQPACGFKLSSR